MEDGELVEPACNTGHFDSTVNSRAPHGTGEGGAGDGGEGPA